MTRVREIRQGFAVWIVSALLVVMTVEALAAVLLVALSASHGLITVEVAVNDALFALNGWLFALVGGLIVSRQSRNTVGWLMVFCAIPMVGSVFAARYAGFGIEIRPGSVPGAIAAAWMANWLWASLLAVFLIPLVFPTGRPQMAGGWWVAGGLLVSTLIMSLYGALAPEIILDSGNLRLANPLAVLPEAGMANFASMIDRLAVLVVLLVVICLASLGLRFRSASRVERQQIKWLLAAAALFVATTLLGLLPSAGILASLLPSLTILGIPLAIGIAIVRYSLYDIDVVIRKTLVYTALTALLAMVYFGSVILLQQLFGALTGIEQSTLAVVISTLVIAALFTPLRRRIQDAIDRRFFRKKYNAQQVLARFALTARDETDLDALLAELVRVVDETLQPEFVGVKLFDPGPTQGRR